MSNTFSNLLFHIIFSTKERVAFLTSAIRARLYPYSCGIAKQNNFTIITINGTDDHVHIMLRLNPDLSAAKAVQLIKGGSSKWIHDNFSTSNTFSWQEGYGAFTVSASQVNMTKQYIANQEQHHKKISFQEEYVEFLKKNNIDFDQKYLF